MPRWRLLQQRPRSPRRQDQYAILFSSLGRDKFNSFDVLDAFLLNSTQYLLMFSKKNTASEQTNTGSPDSSPPHADELSFEEMIGDGSSTNLNFRKNRHIKRKNVVQNDKNRQKKRKIYIKNIVQGEQKPTYVFDPASRESLAPAEQPTRDKTDCDAEDEAEPEAEHDDDVEQNFKFQQFFLNHKIVISTQNLKYFAVQNKYFFDLGQLIRI